MKDNWIKTEEKLPLAYEAGNWDGKRSNLVLFLTKHKSIGIGRIYEGFLDGQAFCEWVDDKDYTITTPVVAWIELPEIY